MVQGIPQNKSWSARPRSLHRKKTEEPKPHELCVCTKHSSVVNAGGGKGGGVTRAVTNGDGIRKTSKGSASTG